MKIYSLFLCFTVLSIAFVNISFATNIVEITYEGESKRKNKTLARKDVFKRSIEETSLDYIKEIIGEEKTLKNSILIRNKILKNSGKYVLFIKAMDIMKTKEGISMTVVMKISLKNLKALLLEEGLLYKLDGPPKTLPMIAFVDRVNMKTYNWWSESADNSFLQDQVKTLHRHLKIHLRERGFFGFLPEEHNFKNSLPEIYKMDKPRKEDLLFVSEFFKSSIVVGGHIRLSVPKAATIDKYQIDVRIQALHSNNGRVIGEVIRTYETARGPFKQVVNKKLIEITEKISHDMSVQLLDAWKRGTFGAELLKLTLNGNLTYLQLTQFKKLILSQVKDIKSLRERFFDMNQVTFEVDASGNAKDLAVAFERQNFPQFKVEVAEVSAEGLVLSVENW